MKEVMDFEKAPDMMTCPSLSSAIDFSKSAERANRVNNPTT